MYRRLWTVQHMDNDRRQQRRNIRNYACGLTRQELYREARIRHLKGDTFAKECIEEFIAEDQTPGEAAGRRVDRMVRMQELVWQLVLKNGRGDKAAAIHRCYGRLVEAKWRYLIASGMVTE